MNRLLTLVFALFAIGFATAQTTDTQTSSSQTGQATSTQTGQATSTQTDQATSTQTGQTTAEKLTQNVAPWGLPRKGFNVGAGFFITTGSPGFTSVDVFGGYRYRAIELAGEYTAGGDNVKAPNVNLKVREQDYLFGPRFYFSRAFSNRRVVPFVHLLFGLSHQSANFVNDGGSSDNAYSWSLGGGIEYLATRNWGVRGRLDVFRTHFLDDSQTHGRFGGSVVYHFRKKGE